ncbi:MAG TPA: hypothetical protein VFE50_11505 [Cyclobacteriaceae bacterium]|nr:hypothetical protein [Cyclobacteriaceae bacterium]
MKRSWQLSVLLFICLACSKPLPGLVNFDAKVWKDDPKGCKGLRRAFYESLEAQRESLKGLSERDLMELLGKPDQKDLSEHHKKIYIYIIEPGPECNPGDSTSTILEVRFNATGVSKEVSFPIIG